MPKFILFDAANLVIGRYDSEIHGDRTINLLDPNPDCKIPAEAVEVSDALFFQTINETDGVWKRDPVTGDIAKHSFPPPSLDSLKAAKTAEINAARSTANTSTFAHGGKEVAVDALSRSDIDGVNGYVALYGGALPPGFPGAWKAVDNTYLPIADVDAWKAFYTSMIAAGGANFAHAQELKAQIAAATTPEQIAAIQW